MSSTATKPIYLRGVPLELVREVKAAAARRGVTLGRFVAEALFDVVHAPQAGAAREEFARDRPRSGAESQQTLAEEMRWYERHRERLVREFDGEFVAIVGRRAIDHDRRFEDLAERVFARHGARDIFMPYVTSRRHALRIASPRIVPRAPAGRARAEAARGVRGSRPLRGHAARR